MADISLNEIRQEKVGVCVSGGLSSTTVAAALHEDGVATVAFIADIGQADRGSINAIVSSLEAAGVDTVVVDLRDDMAQLGLDLVRYGARYEGGYWNTTGASRLVLIRGLGSAMHHAQCTILAHGCVSGGNDQQRFGRYAAQFWPGLRVLAPWSDPGLVSRFPNRSAMWDYLLKKGIAVSLGSLVDYSVDGSLAGFSHESSALERLETSDRAAELLLTAPVWQAPGLPGVIAITFDRGHLAALDGISATPRELLERANDFAGRHGVGVRSVVENRINGTKCRGLYEAPGLELLGFAMSRALEVAHDRDGQEFLHDFYKRIGRSVYEGRYCGLASQAARAGADLLLEYVNATVEVEAFKAGLLFAGMYTASGQAKPLRQTRFNGGGHIWQLAE